MKFIKTHLIFFVIIASLLVGCFILNKKIKELKEELNTVNEELRISLQRGSSLMVKLEVDLKEYHHYYNNLRSNFQYLSNLKNQKESSREERYLASRIIYQYMMRQSNLLNGFEYLLGFPEYSQNKPLCNHINLIRDIETDLISLIMKDTEILIDDEDFLWGQDTLYKYRFDKLKNETEKFFAVIDSID